jgi:NAD(P)H-flavin reductase/truncated hemoglobin YjbI
LKTLCFNGASVACSSNETVLDAFLRQGISVPFSCRNGTCHTCMLVATKGEIPKKSQKGIKSYLIDSGYFLPCQCKPVEDMEMELPRVDELYSEAVIIEKRMLTEDICKILLEPVEPLYYRPGQFINIRHPEGDVRSYSLASVPGIDHLLELHVKRMHGGKVSNWLTGDIIDGDTIEFQGPHGECFYTPASIDQNILLIGAGTGLAPLVGITRDALNSGHTGQLFIYHGAKNKNDLYLHDELLETSNCFENFHYTGSLSRDRDQKDCHYGRVDSIAFGNHEDLNNWGVYLCGHVEMVEQGVINAMSAGALEKDIHGDAFKHLDKRKVERVQESPDSDKMNAMEYVEELSVYPNPDPELWDAVENGDLLPVILEEFYTLVYNDIRLAPFFHGVTKKRAVEKQYSFLHQVFSGEKVYFGDRPRNAHHWMVISNELFDYREEIMEGCLQRHGLSTEMIKRWRAIEESYREQIVKSRPWPKIVNGTRYPLDGFEEIEITVGSICDNCNDEVQPGDKVNYHVRLGTIFCKECQKGA